MNFNNTSDKKVIILIKGYYDFLISMGYRENYDKNINICNLITFLYKDSTIVFCIDRLERLLEISIHQVNNGSLVFNGNTVRLHEMHSNFSFDELYNYEIHPIEQIVQNGASVIREYLNNKI